MTKYISLKETANMIRETLKIEFPGIKFSVRSSSFSNGTAVDVKWVDGPTTSEVDAVVGFYQGSTFDGMNDLSSSVTHTTEAGEEIHYGAKFVQCRRDYSAEFLTHMMNYVTSTYAFTDNPQFELVAATEYCSAYVKANNTTARFGNDWAENFFQKICYKTSASNLPTIPVIEKSEEPTVKTIEEVKPVLEIETSTPVVINPVIAKLQSIDILNLTPLEALNILAALKKMTEQA